jgi:hypothetical protein
MRELFKEMLQMEEVLGVLMATPEGEIIFQEFRLPPSNAHDLNHSLASVMRAMNGIREADFLFDKIRIYIRKTDAGYLIVNMSEFASAAMVRLNCDMVLPSLNQVRRGKGVRQLFKKK